MDSFSSCLLLSSQATAGVDKRCVKVRFGAILLVGHIVGRAPEGPTLVKIIGDFLYPSNP